MGFIEDCKDLRKYSGYNLAGVILVFPFWLIGWMALKFIELFLKK